MGPVAVNSNLPIAVYDEYVRTEWKLLVERRIAGPHIPISDLAKGLGYSYHAIRNWMQQPKYQRYENWRLAQLHEQIVFTEGVARGERFNTNSVPERFQEFALEMQEGLLQIIETTSNEKLRADLMQNWLGYAGHVQQDRPSKADNRPPLSVDDLLMLATRAKEAGLDLALGIRITDGNPNGQGPT